MDCELSGRLSAVLGFLVPVTNIELPGARTTAASCLEVARAVCVQVSGEWLVERAWILHGSA